jgi:ketosteroid isomerase-like protein
MTVDREIQALLDKQAIREVMMRYFRGLDRCDAALIASAYHHDAVDDHGGRTFSGEGIGQGIIDHMRELHIVSGSHHITNQTIHLDGDTAASESYFFGYMLESHEGEERTLQMAGRYLDRLERRNAEWRIAHRLVVPEMAGQVSGVMWLGRPLSYGASDTTDPSYAVLVEHRAAG